MRDEATGQFKTQDKPVATIKRTVPGANHYTLMINDKEIGSDSKTRLERYARTQGYRPQFIEDEKSKRWLDL